MNNSYASAAHRHQPLANLKKCTHASFDYMLYKKKHINIPDGHVSMFFLHPWKKKIEKRYLVKGEIDNFADWLQQSGSSA